MPITDICEAIAAVLHPQLAPIATGPHPPRPDSAAPSDGTPTAEPDSTELHPLAPPDPYTTIYASQFDQWAQIVGELNELRGWGEDPLLHVLDVARRRRAQLDEDIRLLLALGREFVTPKPYEFSSLARAAGLTQYLVRKAYGPEDIECVRQVTKLEPRTAEPDVEERLAG